MDVGIQRIGNGKVIQEGEGVALNSAHYYYYNISLGTPLSPLNLMSLATQTLLSSGICVDLRSQLQYLHCTYL